MGMESFAITCHLLENLLWFCWFTFSDGVAGAAYRYFDIDGVGGVDKATALFIGL